MGKMMQALMAVTAGIVIFLVGYDHAALETDKLAQIADVYKEKDIKLTGWSLYAREEKYSVTDLHTFNELLEDVQKRSGDVKWTIEHKEGQYKATAVKKLSNYEERLVVSATKVNTKYQTFLIYEVKGQHWDDKKKRAFSAQIRKEMDKIFSQKPTIYTCVRGVLSDNMEGVLQKQASQILTSFSAKPIEAVEEEAFVSVSAYTKKWNDALLTEREKMNVQVALRKTNNKTAIVVGTPIITSEY
ncbi:YwmB family TATA-box binding protein [Bacillus sp. 165]|uniref:YwmB family TATA-box binding protein n=1 Tax=Bacillus sp. 165 TaxID=1529117 RepID=UPI001ADB43C7|nr:YwmB family TATA-box binding protein [Bacillus sp. 165]MBO9130045.1 YwmB family TATA-box binding protein [Bacillus sp. 165]